MRDEDLANAIPINLQPDSEETLIMFKENSPRQLHASVPDLLAYVLAELRSCGVQITPGVGPDTVVTTGAVPPNLREAVGYPAALRLALDLEAAAVERVPMMTALLQALEASQTLRGDPNQDHDPTFWGLEA